MSKGSKPRPIENRKLFENNWDIIFNKPKKTICDTSSKCICTKQIEGTCQDTKENSPYGEH